MHNKNSIIALTAFKLYSMKKLIFIVATFLSANMQAQEAIKSRKGENFLPEEKDCALLVDATPVLNYMGQLLSTNGSTSPTFNSAGVYPFTIGAKYFKSATLAYRVKARVGVVSNTVKNTVISNVKTTTDTFYTSDSKTSKQTNVLLSFGFEKRRGKTRLQGYYGAEAALIIGASSQKYSYGNSITKDNPSVYTTNFDEKTATGYANSLQSARMINVKNGATFGLGVRGFVGVEYFIAPKLSIGGEFGWGLVFKNTNDGYYTKERYDAASQIIRNSTPISGSSSFGIDTDNSGGQIMMNFHF
jgi:hypothetical protein